MQFKGKLINQTLENGKKPNTGPKFGPFVTKLGPESFICGFDLYKLLDIVASCHRVQFQGKSKI